MAVLSIDYQNSRQIPPGCKKENHNPNLMIYEGTGYGKKKLAQKAAYRKMGYVYNRWSEGMKAGQTYTVMYYDFGGISNQDFNLHMYTGK